MKNSIKLNSWFIRQAHEKESQIIPASLFTEPLSSNSGWIYSGVADQVQKILLEHGMLDERLRVGETESCAWIERNDWLYACDFLCSEPTKEYKAYINFGGVDLFADFYLNGQLIGSHDNMLVPKRIEITGVLSGENRLLVYFHSTRNRMDELFADATEEFQRYSKPHCLLRKGQIEFGDAGKVSMINTGLYSDVIIEFVDLAEIVWPNIEIDFDYWYRWADLRISVHGRSYTQSIIVSAELFTPDGKLLETLHTSVLGSQEQWTADLFARVNAPALWWPIHYGEQPLYTIEIILLAEGRVLDCVTRKIGLRKVEKTGDMRFRVNGREIKQWGALIEPFDGLTHRWNSQKCRDILDLTVRGNINTLRIWGGSMQFDDEFYDECDALGLLVWHEFCLCWSPAPEDAQYAARYRAEAEYEVMRVKHHACVLLYSGGNESQVGLVEGIPEKLSFGWKPFMKHFKEVCRELDPNRFYLDSSPCGGDYPSDPREGDSHPLYYTYRHAVVQYPLFISEQARSTTGPLRSLRRFMSDEELWPEGYINQVTASQFNPTYNTTYPDKPYYQYDPEYDQKYNVGWSVPQLREGVPFMVTSWKKVPVPNSWWRRAASFFASECSNLERFFDAENIYELIYRINASTAWFFKDDLERIRRGKPHWAIGEPRRCQGYIFVKLNDTWPQLYCTLIDYFQEVNIPYYQFRRSLSPVLLSFDFQDRIYLWGVNDTSEEVSGRAHIRVFSQIRNRVVSEFSIPVSIEAGESKILSTLDRVCPIVTESVVHVELLLENGETLTSVDTLVDLERHQSFPPAELSLKLEDDVLIISTDYYAHCVELIGVENDDEFGWYFEDNYFNLFPYQSKRIKIYGRHQSGTIHAKAHYSSKVTSIHFNINSIES